VDFLPDLRQSGKISETVFQKVACANAIRLLKLDDGQGFPGENAQGGCVATKNEICAWWRERAY